MYKLHRTILSITLGALLSGPVMADLPANEEADIQYLLEFVATSGCTFIRNGDRNDPEAAADHLRLKYRRGKRYFDSAEQFIDRLASESSWTGKKYTIDCNGDISESGIWLHKALDEHRAQAAEASQPQTSP